MKKILIPDAKDKPLLEPEKIICLKAARAYTTVYIEAGEKADPPWKEKQCSYHLKVFETKLAELGFERVNRFIVVNPAYVTGLGTDNTLQLKYNCCGSISFSPLYKGGFMERCVIIIGDVKSSAKTS